MFLLILSLNPTEEGTTDGTLPCKVLPFTVCDLSCQPHRAGLCPVLGKYAALLEQLIRGLPIQESPEYFPMIPMGSTTDYVVLTPGCSALLFKQINYLLHWSMMGDIL